MTTNLSERWRTTGIAFAAVMFCAAAYILARAGLFDTAAVLTTACLLAWLLLQTDVMDQVRLLGRSQRSLLLVASWYAVVSLAAFLVTRAAMQGLHEFFSGRPVYPFLGIVTWCVGMALLTAVLPDTRNAGRDQAATTNDNEGEGQ